MIEQKNNVAVHSFIVFFLVAGVVFFFYQETQSLKKSNQDIYIVIHKYEDSLDKIDSKLVDIQEQNNYSTNQINELQKKVEQQEKNIQEASNLANKTTADTIQSSVEQTYTQLKQELFTSFTTIHSRLKSLSDRINQMEKNMQTKRLSSASSSIVKNDANIEHTPASPNSQDSSVFNDSVKEPANNHK